MPIYEYECSLCHHHFEKRQSFNDEPLEDCPLCRGRVRRVIRSAPVIFKGSGFYVTDSRRNGGTDDSGGSETAAADSGKKETS